MEVFEWVGEKAAGRRGKGMIDLTFVYLIGFLGMEHTLTLCTPRYRLYVAINNHSRAWIESVASQ